MVHFTAIFMINFKRFLFFYWNIIYLQQLVYTINMNQLYVYIYPTPLTLLTTSSPVIAEP